MPYDGSDAGIQRTLAAHASQRELYREAGAEAQTRMVLELLGCTRTVESLFEGYTTTAMGEVAHSIVDAPSAEETTGNDDRHCCAFLDK